MVVCQVIRIRNNTLRTYVVRSADYFSAPRLGGKPMADGVITVPPGFDQSSDGLVVPWESMTRSGLVVVELGSVENSEEEDTLRCVVGPWETDDDGCDWLRFHTGSWAPVATERWLLLGRRHLLGAVGTAVEVQLTFRDARSKTATGPASLAEITHFERAASCAPPSTVFLNVFDLASALSIPNAILNNTMMTSLGAFHAAVEVYNDEWSFYRTPNPHSCGVCKSQRPRNHPVHVYRQSVNLGQTTLKTWEVQYLVRARLAPNWTGGSYDMLNHNCIHFCDELLLTLGVQPVPPWVRGLHETGAALFWLPYAVSCIFGGGGDNAAPAREGQHEVAGASVTCQEGHTEGATPTSSGGARQEANAVGPNGVLRALGNFVTVEAGADGGTTETEPLPAPREPRRNSNSGQCPAIEASDN